MKKSLLIIVFYWFIHSATEAQSTVRRLLVPADFYRLATVSEPQVSPDGNWIAYTLTSVDTAKDKQASDIWMVSWDGTQNIQLTNTPEDETNPSWSPDGKWISFLSERQGVKGKQVWLMDRRGGEGKKLTDYKDGVNEYAWSPDSKKLLLNLTDPDTEDTTKDKPVKPYVIDRYQYKEDIEGYRYKKLFSHLYLFDLASKKIDTLTRGNYNEEAAAFSPDGTQVVYVSNRSEDPDRNENTDLFIVTAVPGSVSRQLTTWKGSDNSPKWSPDGKWIAYSRSTEDNNYLMYDQPVLGVISKDGGEPKLLSLSIDRPVINPRWSSDGKSIMALMADDRQLLVANFSVPDGKLTRIADGERSFSDLETANGKWVAVMSDPQTPEELYAIENKNVRRITHQMDSFLAPLTLATEKGFRSKSSDGTEVSGLLFLPPNAPPGKKLPLILFIHGGPVDQDDYEFDITRQMLSAGGYAVAAVNYRGSWGRGLKYNNAIFGDWGNKEVLDIHGAVDWLVKEGIVDSSRLGVAGWSYGGILTDYLIASDRRFKAASSGAGTGFTLSLYGVDEYVRQYENELGVPWKHIDTYLKISYPFLKADQIKTPTLFMASEKDFNVPSAGSEQMYQALRSLGTPTQLIIYPGQFHGITVPSYRCDRYERWLAWFGKYLGSEK